jgi:hypothetical protein
MDISGLTHAALAPALLRFAFALPLTRKAGFRPAGWPLPGGCRTLWIATKGFSSHVILPSCSPDASRVGEEVTPLAPHSPERARLTHSVLRA